MNNELRILDNNQINNQNLNSYEPDQTNRIEMLNYFKKVIIKNDKSIISKIFYILLENVTICQSCKISKYNYQSSFYLEFPLKFVYQFCIKNNISTKYNNKISISLLSCFQQYCQETLSSKDNYCNICKSKKDVIYINNIYSLPPILILVLDRGIDNIFNCNVDFP